MEAIQPHVQMNCRNEDGVFSCRFFYIEKLVDVFFLHRKKQHRNLQGTSLDRTCNLERDARCRCGEIPQSLVWLLCGENSKLISNLGRKKTGTFGERGLSILNMFYGAGIFTLDDWVIYGINVVEYSIHRAYGYGELGLWFLVYIHR